MRKIIVVYLCIILMVSVFGAIIPTNTSAYTTHDPIYIDGNANFTAANGVSNPEATGDETDPYIIEDWDINASSANGIMIFNTDAYFIIRNCYVHDGGLFHEGIYLYNVTNGRVENTILSNNWHGIWLAGSSYNNIFNNRASNNRGGIVLGHSSYNNISNNSANSNSYCGIFLYYLSSNNILFNNSANSNSDIGIYLGSSNNNIFNNNALGNKNGIWLTSSSDNNIYNNNASNNWYGIYLSYSSSNNNIYNNNVLNNSYGIILSGSHYNNIYNNNVLNNYYGFYSYISYKNSVYHNNFIDNVVQGCDYGVNNQWDDGYPSGGNYWSDYAGVDEKNGPNQDQPGSDGIGDTPYNISGVSGGRNKDQYPLMSPWGKLRILVEKEFIPSEITTINQGVISMINITNIGNLDITSMTIIDEYVENMAFNELLGVLVTITSDEGEVYAIMPENLTVTPGDNDITISFELPLEVVPVYWENGMIYFGEGTYYLESIPKDWIVGVLYLLYPIAELEIGTYTADAMVTAYSETGTSVTETATGTLIVSEPF